MAGPQNSNAEYELLEARLKTLLPEEYQDSYEDVQPVSMGSAGLKYGKDGRVAWDEIWGSFCDLAMAGGPPHRGTLLEPATKAEIKHAPERYEQVCEELCRGVEMVTALAAEPSAVPGWIEVDCPNTGMAGWLARAIVMENVSAHVEGMVLHLPAAPGFRVEKEIKNVVTSAAKTCHYWVGHTSVAQHRAIGELFKVMQLESPLIQAPFAERKAPGDAKALRETLCEAMAAKILAQTGLTASGRAYSGWLGVDCGEVRPAVWMMRVMIASNVMCRREGNFVYLPVNKADREDERVTALFARAYRMARAAGLIQGGS
jgi:sirohydrochlorin cobaltochelatase